MKRFLSSIKFALQGVSFCFRQQNLKIQSVAALLTILLAACTHCAPLEWTTLILCIALVLGLEMMNTAVEVLCDLYSTEKNSSIKIIKDVAAGAVLLAATGSVCIAAIIFLPKLNWLWV